MLTYFLTGLSLGFGFAALVCVTVNVFAGVRHMSDEV